MDERTEPIPVEAERARLAAVNLLQSTLLALQDLQGTWDHAQVEGWCTMSLKRSGRVILSGMGKSGLVAQKIAATLASTGCPSLFLHPAEALHGDLGMVTREDSLLILSNSGETEEVLRLLPNLLRLGVPIASITSNPTSSLARASNWCFNYGLPSGEGCPLNYAPMASTTLQLIWGDLLAAYRMAATGFTTEGFASLHPAGNLGSKFLKAKDLMHAQVPVVAPDTSLLEVLEVMNRGRLGMAAVVHGSRLRGVISDGDLRRGLSRNETQPLSLLAQDLMTEAPRQVAPETLAIEAARIMEASKITFLVVMEAGSVQGILHIHDLLEAKVI